MKAMKAASCNAMGDRGGAESQISQLPMRHNPVLLASEPRDQRINRPNRHLEPAIDEVC